MEKGTKPRWQDSTMVRIANVAASILLVLNLVPAQALAGIRDDALRSGSDDAPVVAQVGSEEKAPTKADLREFVVDAAVEGAEERDGKLVVRTNQSYMLRLAFAERDDLQLADTGEMVYALPKGVVAAADQPTAIGDVIVFVEAEDGNKVEIAVPGTSWHVDGEVLRVCWATTRDGATAEENDALAKAVEQIRAAYGVEFALRVAVNFAKDAATVDFGHDIKRDFVVSEQELEEKRNERSDTTNGPVQSLTQQLGSKQNNVKLESREVTNNVTKTDEGKSAANGGDLGKSGDLSLRASGTDDGQPSATVNLKVTKQVDGDYKGDEQFTFALAKHTSTEAGVSDDEDGITMHATLTKSIKAGEIATFDDITFTKEGEYHFTIKETQGNAAGMKYDTEAKYAKVVVTNDADELKTVTTYGTSPDDCNDSSLTVTNTYAGVDGEVLVKKNLVGRSWKSGDTFTFELQPVTPDAPMPATKTVSVTSTTSDYTTSFGQIAFTKPDTYEYTVTEQKGTAEGIAYDTTPHSVKFVVKYDDLGHLVAAEDSSLIQTVEITNVYGPSIEKKVMDVNDSTGVKSDWQDSADYDIGDAVPFKLTATLANNVTSYSKYHITFTDQMEESLSFNKDSGISEVRVLKDGKPVKNYTGDQIKALLTASGVKPTEHSFALRLDWEGKDGATINEERLNGAIVEVYFSATLNSSAKFGKIGNVNRCKLEHSNNPADEDSKDELPWDYVNVFTYKLDINKLDENSKALTGAKFKLEKVIKDAKNKEIDLTVKDNTYSAAGLDDGTYILTETEAPTGYEKVDPITFEVKATHNPVWADWASGTAATADFDKENKHGRKEVLTALTGNATSGTLTLTKTNDDLEGLTGSVKNAKPSAKVKLQVKKVVDGDYTGNEQFTFTLAKASFTTTTTSSTDSTSTSTTTDTSDGITMPATTTKSIKAGQTATFDDITFTEEGIHYFTITEKAGTTAGMTYDTTAKYAKVDVKKDATTGKLKATVTYGTTALGATDTSLTVTNKYGKSASVALQVTKQVVGDSYKGTESFTFTLAQAPYYWTSSLKRSDVMPKTLTAAAKAGGTATFGAITYSEPGTYMYTITEQAGKTSGMSYDTTPKYVVVTVNEDMSTKVTYGYSWDSSSYTGLSAADRLTKMAEQLKNGTFADDIKDNKLTVTNRYTPTTTNKATTTSTTTRTATPTTADPTSVLAPVALAASGMASLAAGVLRRRRRR